MIEKIDTNQIQAFVGKSSSSQPGSAKSLTNNDVDMSLQLDYDSLIKGATQAPQTDTEAVQKAQELLSSGQLETPENIRKTAENIIKFGI